MSSPPYAVIVPVKPTTLGKSRLGDLAGSWRSALAEAFAADTLRAAVSCASVARLVVVTDDDAVAAVAEGLGAQVLPDPGLGLNAALRHGAAALAGHVPVALLADLPALTPEDLGTALALIDATAGGFVADADGTGTSLYAAGDFRPAFGAESRAAHLRTGAVEVMAAVETLRRDVDDLAGLRAAADLGVGPATRRVLTQSRLLDLP